MKLMDLDSAFDFCFVNREAANFFGSDALSPIKQRKCETTLCKNLPFFRLRTKDFAINLKRYQKPFMAGSLELDVAVDLAVDPNVVHEIAAIAGPKASRRIICHFRPKNAQSFGYLRRLPESVTQAMILEPTYQGKTRKFWFSDGITCPTSIRRVCFKSFPMQDPRFEIRCISLDRLTFDRCTFPGSGCDLSLLQQLGSVHLKNCEFTSWDFFEKLPKKVAYLELDGIEGMFEDFPALPELLKHVSFVGCNIFLDFNDIWWKLPDGLLSFELLNPCGEFGLFTFSLPEGLLSLRIVYDRNREETLEIDDLYVDYIFPESIRKIYIDTGTDDCYNQQHPYWRAKWAESLERRHPRADITII